MTGTFIPFVIIRLEYSFRLSDIIILHENHLIFYFCVQGIFQVNLLAVSMEFWENINIHVRLAASTSK